MDIIKDDYLEDGLVSFVMDVVSVTDAKKLLKKSASDKAKEEPEEPEEEPEEEDISRFEATAQEADEVNKNKRLYPKKVLEAALRDLQPKLKRKEVFAMSDHPSFFDGPRIGRIAAIIHEASLNDKNKVIIKGEFLDNDAAKEVKSLLKMGVKVGVSARGYGDYDVDPKNGVAIFKDGYEIEGWDFVVYPAANAKVTHFESEDKNVNKPKEEKKMEEIRTLDGLRAAYPELVASLEKPLVDEAAKVAADAETKVADLTAKLTAAETATAELKGQFDALNTRNTEVCKALDEVNGKLQIAVDENTKMKADIAAAELKLAIDALMKDNKYAQFMKIDPSLDTIEKVKAFVDAETAKFDAFAASMKPATETKAEVKDEVIVEQPKAKAEDTKAETKPADPTMDAYIDLATKKSSKLL